MIRKAASVAHENNYIERSSTPLGMTEGKEFLHP